MLLAGLSSVWGITPSEPKTAPSEIFSKTLQIASEELPQVRQLQRTKPLLLYETASECIVVSNNSGKYWNKTTNFNGTKVYQRDDLFDPTFVDAKGRSNLERMQKGLAPIGTDGRSINLHHTIQSNDGPVAEVLESFHKQNHSTIHINPNTIPSGIDRKAFNSFRRNYWKSRANDF